MNRLQICLLTAACALFITVVIFVSLAKKKQDDTVNNKPTISQPDRDFKATIYSTTYDNARALATSDKLWVLQSCVDTEIFFEWNPTTEGFYNKKRGDTVYIESVNSGKFFHLKNHR